jgi:hypothetical protein
LRKILGDFFTISSGHPGYEGSVKLSETRSRKELNDTKKTFLKNFADENQKNFFEKLTENKKWSCGDGPAEAVQDRPHRRPVRRQDLPALTLHPWDVQETSGILALRTEVNLKNIFHARKVFGLNSILEL